MLDAALEAGAADRRVTFEVFTRSLPPGRRHGVFAGLGRLLDALEDFRFGPDEIEWIRSQGIVSDATAQWLAGFSFGGDIHAYPEGELYTGGSPVLTVEGSFAETVLLETLFLSILNHDSSVAAAASLIATAAGSRPVIEMGSRRVDDAAAVAAARAAYLGGFASTSNLEAGRRYGIPTAGTSAHAFVLLFPDERSAFAAQLARAGSGTTLLVDTYDAENAIETAIQVAGTSLEAVRIDSGDLAFEVRRARALLDSLGATTTKVIVTGDLDDRAVRELADSPADAYGAGTSVVTGLGHPTAGLIYKLVSVEGRNVAKASPGKATLGGRKWAWRRADDATEIVSTSPDAASGHARPLQSRVVAAGRRLGAVTLEQSRAHLRESLAELPEGASLRLLRV
jgi:nicotinate phosphoribosyltransferase